MQVLPSFDPSVGMGGTINVSAVDPGSKILLYNLSIFTLQLNFDNGDSTLIHAGEANYWELDGSTTTIAWIQYSKLNALQPASSQVTGIVYRSDESIEGTYPMALTYNVSVGNTITTSQGSTMSIINDGNPAGTVLVESTPATQTNSAVNLTVDGLLKLSTLIAGTLVQLIKTEASGNPLLLGAAGTITEVLGNLTVDGSLRSGGIISGPVTSSGGASSFSSVSAGASSFSSVSSGPITSTGASTYGSLSGGTITSTGASTYGTLSGGTIASTGASTFGPITSSGGQSTFDQLNTLGTAYSGGVSSGVIATNMYNDLSGNSIVAITPSTSITRVQSPAHIYLQIPAGTNVMGLNSTGMSVTGTGNFSDVLTASNGLVLISGQLTRNARQTNVSLNAGANTVTHNLGWAPQVVTPMCVTSGKNASVGWTSANTTTVIINVSVTATYDITYWTF